MDPIEGSHFDVLLSTPWTFMFDDLGFVEAVDRLSQGIEAPIFVKQQF